MQRNVNLYGNTHTVWQDSLLQDEDTIASFDKRLSWKKWRADWISPVLEHSDKINMLTRFVLGFLVSASVVTLLYRAYPVLSRISHLIVLHIPPSLDRAILKILCDLGAWFALYIATVFIGLSAYYTNQTLEKKLLDFKHDIDYFLISYAQLRDKLVQNSTIPTNEWKNVQAKRLLGTALYAIRYAARQKPREPQSSLHKLVHNPSYDPHVMGLVGEYLIRPPGYFVKVHPPSIS